MVGRSFIEEQEWKMRTCCPPSSCVRSEETRPCRRRISIGGCRKAEVTRRFQGRENKRDQLKELREQFQRDRERIQKMKENRKFNPVSHV